MSCSVSRGIPDVDYAPSTLLAAPGVPPGALGELDMTYCTLRGVSPIHLEYMRNMGVAASMGISLLSENSLWGMIIGHHATPKMMSAELRALGDVIGQLMSALIQQLTETEHLAKRLSRTHAVTGLRRRLESPETLAGGLSRHAPLVLDLMDATGAFISLGSATHCIGVTPPVEKAAEIVGALRKLHAEDIVGVSDAGRPGGISAACADTASGVLVMPIINNPGDAIAWFRPELVRTVHWAGDPRKLPSVDVGRLSPRHSFAAWRQEVRGSSVPWTPVDLETARELRRVITVLLLGQARAQLTHLSTYDPLTSLVNRQTVKAHLDRRRHDGEAITDSVLFLDLDRFKAINESLGHAAGDQVLVEFAARLRRLTPEGGLAGRLGSDEFVILWPGAGRPQAEALAAALRPDLAEPYLLNNGSHQLRVSIGIACSGVEGLDDLLREAEEAMHAAKQAGGDTIVVFDASMHATALSAVRLEQDLFLAVQNNEIEIHYQPVSAVPGRGLIGFEALARWRHPRRGWVPPGEFIPLAEETGLIVKVGAWVLTGAVRQIAAWRREHGDVSMSVNVSARQLMTGSLSALLATVLAEEKVEAAAVVIEVTESALMHEAAVRELHLVRGLGVKVSVDDFGTGYSSLSYLQKLPVDIVKIDRGFVTPLGSSRKADGLFARIVDLAHTLELRTVAEGCETEEQWGVIESAGCDAIQGWLVAPALEAGKASAFLAAGRGQPPMTV